MDNKPGQTDTATGKPPTPPAGGIADDKQHGHGTAGSGASDLHDKDKPGGTGKHND